MPGRDVVSLPSPNASAEAIIRDEFEFPCQNDSLMMVFAAASADDWLHVLGPAPTRLVNQTRDMHLPERHHLSGKERKRDDLVRLVEPFHDARHTMSLRR